MLEHAEIAIAAAPLIADAQAVAKQDRRTQDILRVIEQVEKFWQKDRLPENIRILAMTIIDLLQACSIETDQLRSILDGEKRRCGLLPTELSPYAFTVQALAHTDALDFKKNLWSIKNYVLSFTLQWICRLGYSIRTIAS